MTEEQRFGIFFVAWLAMGVFSFVSMKLATTEQKILWYPRFTIGGGFLLVGFIYWVIPTIPVLVFSAVGVTVMTLIGLKMTKICSGCGAVLRRPNWFSEMRFCWKCGTDLRQPPAHSQKM
jgi:hypothetical protein